MTTAKRIEKFDRFGFDWISVNKNENFVFMMSMMKWNDVFCSFFFLRVVLLVRQTEREWWNLTYDSVVFHIHSHELWFWIERVSVRESQSASACCHRRLARYSRFVLSMVHTRYRMLKYKIQNETNVCSARLQPSSSATTAINESKYVWCLCSLMLINMNGRRDAVP